jgi:hypothetical protein
MKYAVEMSSGSGIGKLIRGEIHRHTGSMAIS